MTQDANTDFVPNIRHIQLVNGEEIFGHVETAYDDNSGESIGFIVHKPMKTVEYSLGGGQIGIMLSSWLPYQEPDKQACFIQDQHILCMSGVASEVQNFYHLQVQSSNEQDLERLDNISETNFQMSNRLFDEQIAEKTSNGSILGPTTSSVN